MSYKAFQDWYSDANIRHLVLHKYNDYLISPPFGTEKCPEYNKILKYDGEVSYIDTDLPPAVSKINCAVNVDDSVWFIPYGIYDEFNIVLQLKGDIPVYHKVDSKGKGQFYSGDSNGVEAFSFPLGYSDTQYGLYIKNDIVQLINFDHSVPKAHMGTVYCNGKFYSMPRGDESEYDKLVSFDGDQFEYYSVPTDNTVSRKYTDLVSIKNKLYSLPYGESPGLTQVVEFDTETKEFKLYDLDVPDFAKKFNCMVLVDDCIIGLPYGSEYTRDSNYGVVFDSITKESKSFDIGINFGGKYRYRCGINYNNTAVFFPTGTPSCPILAIDVTGTIVYKKHYQDLMFGRPIIYQDKITVLAYNIENEKHYLYCFDKTWNETIIPL